MSGSRISAAVGAMAMLFALTTGTAAAKLPAPSEEQKAKAVEAKAKADEAAKRDAELLGRYQDRAADNYKRGKLIKTGTGAKR